MSVKDIIYYPLPSQRALDVFQVDESEIYGRYSGYGPGGGNCYMVVTGPRSVWDEKKEEFYQLAGDIFDAYKKRMNPI
jgi:hypothetical protein